jgi:hypothetical protein
MEMYVPDCTGLHLQHTHERRFSLGQTGFAKVHSMFLGLGYCGYPCSLGSNPVWEDKGQSN